MQNCTKNLTLVHYADDTTAFAVGNDIDGLFTVINEELYEADRWLCANKLSLNVTKTSYMLFSARSRQCNGELYIRESRLTRVSNAKFLGITIDDNLNFKAHVNCVRSKVSKSSGVIFKLSQYLSEHVLRKLYLSLVILT